MDVASSAEIFQNTVNNVLANMPKTRACSALCSEDITRVYDQMNQMTTISEIEYCNEILYRVGV